MTTDAVIDIAGLVKTFGSVRALDGLDLTVTKGEVHGFLGPNGAGKSTTIRALLGMLRVDGGTATVFGKDPWQDAVTIHRRLAYVPGDVALWPNLSGGETIDMLLRMRGADPAAGDREEMLGRFDFDPTKKGRAYSKGNRQKVALVAAFAADVDLLILDEPTSGLDPLMEQVFADCVAERVQQGTTVVLAVGVGVLAALAAIAGGLPVAGSVGFGATWTGIGLVATALTAVACQLAASGRTCFGIAGAAIALLYLMRAVGDVGAEWLSWCSPFGWNTRLSAWSDPRWWVLLLYVALAAGLVVSAQALRARRDLGAGLFAARPGPPHGSPRLADVVALTWRVHRQTLLSWTVAVAAFGTVLGAIAPSVGDLLDTGSGRDLIESIGGTGALEDSLLAAVLSISAVVITCFGLTVVARGGADEHDGRTEQVLATATSRSRTLLASVAVALGGVVWLLAVTGLATAVGLGRDAGGLVEAGLAQAPAVWLVVGLALLLYAVRSGWSAAGWFVLALFFAVGQVSEMLKLPAWVTGLSPYTHSPAMPAEAFRGAPAAVLTALAAACVAAAWWRYRSRDIG